MTIGVSPLGGSFLAQLFPAVTRGVISQPEAVAPGEVLVASSHDRIDLVLDKHEVPYQLVERRRIAGPSLDDARYLFIGCGESLPQGSPERIAEWVERGGWLLTTDWMVHRLLGVFRGEDGLPLIRHHMRLSAEGEGVFPVSEAAWSDPAVNALLEGGERLFWKLAKCAYPVAVPDPERVEVLARSRSMGHLFQGADALIARAAYGRGGLLYLVGHWDAQVFDQPPHSHPSEGPPSSRSSFFSIPPDLLKN
jgi:hypothetical protein